MKISRLKDPARASNDEDPGEPSMEGSCGPVLEGHRAPIQQFAISNVFVMVGTVS